MKTEYIARLLITVSALMSIFCMQNDPQAGIEVTNGNCVGKIYTREGKPASKALVQLIPSSYSSAFGEMTVDSTYTTGSGSFAFDIDSSGFYSIIAELDGTMCMQDSVSIITDGVQHLDNDTLDASGTIEGTVTVRTGDDPRNTIILVNGTATYTSPYDSAGNFKTPPLPAGNFTITVFSTSAGYDTYTAVTSVTPGEKTTFDIHISNEGAPDVSGFTATYDKATKIAVLQWDPVDTAQIQAYALHRTTLNNGDTLITLSKNTKAYRDDLLYFDRDSVTYALAAVGNSFTEGYPAATPAFDCSGNLTLAATTDSLIVPEEYRAYSIVFADIAGDMYLTEQNRIIRANADFTILNEYTIPFWNIADPVGIPDTTAASLRKRTATATDIIHTDDEAVVSTDITAYRFTDKACNDNEGNIYILAKLNDTTSTRTTIVCKFDKTLSLIDTMIIPEPTTFKFNNMYGDYHQNDTRMTVTGSGSIYLFWTAVAAGDGTDAGTISNRVAEYGSDGSLADIRVLDYTMYNPVSFGDTILGLSYLTTDSTSGNPTSYAIIVLDTALTRLGKIQTINPKEEFCSGPFCDPEEGNYNQILMMPGSCYISTMNTGVNQFFIYDLSGTIKARIGGSLRFGSWCRTATMKSLYFTGAVYTDDGNWINYDGTTTGTNYMVFIKRMILSGSALQ